MAYPMQATDEDVLITEGAVVVGDVTLEKGVSVWYNAVVRGDQGPIRIGRNTNIQECAVLHEGAVVGAGCTVGHGAIVHGCTVGSGTLIGMGAIVLSGAVIGKNCIVGAGALVTGKMNIPDGSMVLGSPAKVVRPVTEADLETVWDGNRYYVRLRESYR